MKELPPLPLWQFSLRLYTAPDVKQACLHLQDEHDFDVIIVMAVVFAASRGVVLDEEGQGALLAASEASRQRVRALRALRRGIDGRPGDPYREALYQSLLQAELEAERVAARDLQGALPDRGDRSAVPESGVRRALETYGRRCGAGPSAWASIEAIVRAAMRLAEP